MIYKITRYTCDRCSHQSESIDDNRKAKTGHMTISTEGHLKYDHGHREDVTSASDWICVDCTESFRDWWNFRLVEKDTQDAE